MNAKQTLRTLISTPTSVSVMLKGNHGIGKSEVVKLAAKKMGIPCIDFRLSQNDVGDIKGLPYRASGRTIFAPPEFFPLKEADAIELKELLKLEEDISLGRYGDCGILFLDEINRATREVQQAAFELVLDRRLNLRSLPDGWRVVTAINDNDDLYSVGSLDPAFISRFFLIDFNPTYEEWMDWARESGVHQSVVQFLIKNKNLLDPTREIIENNAQEGVKKLYDRRSWHKFSDTIKSFESNDDSLLVKEPETLDYLTMVATGFLGSTCAIKFRGFVELDYDALNADAILNGWTKAIAKKLKDIADKGRIPELASYNELILEHFKTNGTLNPKVKSNLSNYLEILPKEVVSGFWQSFNKEHKELSEEWYKHETRNVAIILAAIVNPAARKA